MKCLNCGKTMRTRRENHRYSECGLPNVVLVNVRVNSCSHCGEREVVIPRIEELHRSIAQFLARKPARLAREEIRFLRKYLGWSGADFAAKMKVRPETVSRWEQGTSQMAHTAELLLRTWTLTRRPEQDYPLDEVDLEKELPKKLRLDLRLSGGSWQAGAA